MIKSIMIYFIDAYTNFKERSWYSKIFYIIEYPFTLLRDMTCPIVEEERWNKYWLLCSSVGAPFVIALFSDGRNSLRIIDQSDSYSYSIPV